MTDENDQSVSADQPTVALVSPVEPVGVAVPDVTPDSFVDSTEVPEPVAAPVPVSEPVDVTDSVVLYVISSGTAPISDIDSAMISEFSDVTMVDAATDIALAQSFGFTYFPLFVLMKNGVQLWKANSIPMGPSA